MQWHVRSSEAQQRVDRFLLKLFPRAKRAEVFALFRKKDVHLNGVRAKISDRIQEGDVLEVYLHPERERAWRDEQKKAFGGTLYLVREEPEWAVFFKKAGMLSVPTKKEEVSLAGQVQSYYKERITPTFAPSPVSRLDRNTSGLVLFGTSYDSLKSLSKLMRERQIHKRYLALLRGELTAQQEVHLKQQRDAKRRLSMKAEQGKEARTLFVPLACRQGTTLVDVQIFTGRTHQIRLAAQEMGHPLVGDSKYGQSSGGQMLCAYLLQWKDKKVSYIDPEFISRLPKEYAHEHLPQTSDSSRSLQL